MEQDRHPGRVTGERDDEHQLVGQVVGPQLAGSKVYLAYLHASISRDHSESSLDENRSPGCM
jgi:hypothetical protein